MDKIYGIIYKIKNKENNKYYIGQTTSDMGFKGRYRYSGEGIERVYKHNLKQKEKGNSYNNYLLFSIEKYGFEAFEVDEEFDIAYSKEELDELEIKYIKEFNCIIPNGYNISYGGSSGKHSETTKQKLREINLGKHHTEESKKKMSESRKGRVFSEEHRRRLSEAEKGEKNHNYGKHLSEETKQKIREAVSGENNPMYGKGEERRGLKNVNTKIIYCEELDKIWIGLKECSKELGVSTGYISVCIKENKKCKGYTLKYKPRKDNNDFSK